MQLKSLTYTSRARLDLADADLHDIHREAGQLNALDGITGLLVFDGARFLQIVEGAPDAIDSLVERLRRDTRHAAFEIRDEREVAERSFPHWSMELVRVSAGYLAAREELATSLPPTVTQAVRALALRMSLELAAAN
ncbi:MAG TPA: BLUF domain-containing protein [Allosphingosinicella sp.]|jgi:hypothetical protein